MAADLPHQSWQLFEQNHIEFPITVRDVYKTGSVVDLTGATARFTMAREQGGTLVVDTDASPALATIAITDAVNGLMLVTITDENSVGLAGDYYWSAIVTDNGGRRSTVARGWLTFEQ